MKLKAIGFAVVAAIATASAVAADLTLVGDSATIWNTAVQCWTNSAGASVKFQDGDNVLISSDYFTGPSLTIATKLNPGNVVVDIDRTLILGWDNNSQHGLWTDTGSFTKRGTGTLLLQKLASTAGQNMMTCGVDIVEGEIACVDRNVYNFLGSRTTPYWVHVHPGASLTFLQGNQTGAADVSDGICGIKIQLDAGARLNHCTNFTASGSGINSCLNVNTLKLCGGDIVNGAYAFQDKIDLLGGHRCMAKIFNTLWFSGDTPHAFGFPDNAYPGYKHYSMDGTLNRCLVSLNPNAPVEIRVDDIDGGDGVDAYMNWLAFTWGQNASGAYRCDLVKTGAGTLVFPSNDVARVFNGDFTVKEGRVELL